MKDKILENEIITGLHFLRKSSASFVEDLKYFSDLSSHFSIEKAVSVLGQIEEVEKNIEKIRNILVQKI